MTISLLQTDITWASPLSNRIWLEQMLLTAKKSDLYVLPEMFSTGFVTQPQGIAESEGGGTLEWMKRMAVRLDAAICGSIAISVNLDKDRHPRMKPLKNPRIMYYNRLYFITSDGEVYTYDKHHLFTYGEEHLRYTAGSDRCVVYWRGFRFNLAVCYDLRFPTWTRNNARSPYDVLLYVANWPESRRAAWDTLLRARAIENQCYVVGVNRVGDDPVCHYNGGTCAIDAYGKTLVQATDNENEVLTFTLDKERLNAFRKKFPVLQDAD